MRILELTVLSMVLLILAACISGDEDGGSPDGSATAGADGTSIGGAVSGDGVPSGGSVDLLAGVVWERVDGPRADGLSTAYDVFTTSGGFVAFGRSLPAGATGPAEARLAAWQGDASGASWTVSEVDPALATQSVEDVAERDGVLVAIGNEHTSCSSSDAQPLGRFCSNSAARALWSDDGGASWHGAAAALGVQGTHAPTVVATADGFVPAGRDEAGGSIWQLVVWASADGKSWREVSRFTDPQWPLYTPDLEVVADTVLLLGQRAVCSESSLNGNDRF